MQQFFLFCTMLIVASETFSKELHGNKVSASVKRKFSRFAPKYKYPNSERFMVDGLDLRMSSVPSLYEIPDSEASFASPLRRRDFEQKKFGKNSFLHKKKNLSSRQRFRKKFLKKRKRNSPWPFYVADSYILNSPQCFEKQRLSDSDAPFDNVFGDVFDSQPSVSVRYPNQYIVCVYPVFNNKKFRLKKKTLRIFKNRGFSALKRQYLPDFKSKRSKNKRSTNSTTTTEETASEEKKQKVTTTQKYLENPGIPKRISHFPYGIDNFPYGTTNPYDSLESPNPSSFPTPLSEGHPSPYKFSPLPYTDLKSAYLDVTRPSFDLPKINFKYPYDPEVYETSLRSDSSLFHTFKPKGLSESEGKSAEKPASSSPPPDLAALKAMLDEVEAVLRDENNKSILGDSKAYTNKQKSGGKSGKKKKSKSKGECELTQKNLKEKIDHIAIPTLLQISQALENMPQSTPVKNSSSLRCSADGTWISSMLGMEMTFTTMPNMVLKVQITTSKEDSVINSKWSVHGLTLSKTGGPLMLAAIYPQKRQIASFIGQCKMCRNQDLIFGTWTIYTCMQRFSDLWRAVDIKLDILKKQKPDHCGKHCEKSNQKKN